MWSLCCTVDHKGRILFNDFIRNRLKELNLTKVDIPDEGSIYDYKFNLKDNDWELWTEEAASFRVDISKTFA